MKLYFPCMSCFPRPEGLSTGPIRVTKCDLRDDGVYDVTCSEGHRQIASVQGPRFQTLFEVAVNAILDGYYREAILSFSGSLERFLDYYVEIIALKKMAFHWRHIKAIGG